ncbi:hypothetical protein BIW53_08735 [Pseudoalteromonas byunsanensis]|uniref:Uncharacterized protein n=1 Tax=Pseudoalteromonas byunsanensis TaxID=327939 RepID=A0A1S1N8Y0_9GAMM|nr:hypothetical protein BIW53_08735 [Pseudoalteromonas byunsanensis]
MGCYGNASVYRVTQHLLSAAFSLCETLKTVFICNEHYIAPPFTTAQLTSNQKKVNKMHWCKPKINKL